MQDLSMEIWEELFGDRDTSDSVRHVRSSGLPMDLTHSSASNTEDALSGYTVVQTDALSRPTAVEPRELTAGDGGGRTQSEMPLDLAFDSDRRDSRVRPGMGPLPGVDPLRSFPGGRRRESVVTLTSIKNNLERSLFSFTLLKTKCPLSTTLHEIHPTLTSSAHSIEELLNALLPYSNISAAESEQPRCVSARTLVTRLAQLEAGLEKDSGFHSRCLGFDKCTFIYAIIRNIVDDDRQSVELLKTYISVNNPPTVE